VHIITISDQEFYSENEGIVAKPEFVDKALVEVENQGDKSP
jgi:hypothetical protein